MVLYKDKDSEIYKIAGASAADVAGLPIGTIIAYYSDKVPDDFLLCDGSEYDIAKYPKLYQLLETNVLPDLRNRTLFGKDAETLGDTTDGKLPNITGTTGNPIFDGSRSAFANWGGTIAGAFTRTAKISNTDWYVSSLGSNSNGRYNLQFDASRVSDIYQDTDKVVPSSVYINYIIKALDNSATIDYDTSQTEAIIHAAVQKALQETEGTLLWSITPPSTQAQTSYTLDNGKFSDYKYLKVKVDFQYFIIDTPAIGEIKITGSFSSQSGFGSYGRVNTRSIRVDSDTTFTVSQSGSVTSDSHYNGTAVISKIYGLNYIV